MTSKSSSKTVLVKLTSKAAFRRAMYSSMEGAAMDWDTREVATIAKKINDFMASELKQVQDHKTGEWQLRQISELILNCKAMPHIKIMDSILIRYACPDNQSIVFCQVIRPLLCNS